MSSIAENLTTIVKLASGAREAAPLRLQVVPEPEQVIADSDTNDLQIVFPITKVALDKQEITGVVLEPETVDAQGDIISKEVIEKAAGDFLEKYNNGTQLGLQHKKFNVPFTLRQSFIAPVGMTINSKIVKEGSWLMVVKVNDSLVWGKVKDGKITGFSIGGVAKVKQLAK